MSRLDEALRQLAAGGPAILTDEDHNEVCCLVVGAGDAHPEAFEAQRRHGTGDPVLWLGAGEPATFPAAEALDHDGFGSGRPEGMNLIDSNQREQEDVRESWPLLRHGDRPAPPPRRTAPNGVLERVRDAEAAIDALRLAGRRAAAYLQPVILPGGILADEAAAEAVAAALSLPTFSIQDVIAERLSRETIVEFAASARLPSIYAEGSLEVQAFRSLIDGGEHLAMIHKPMGREPLVRLHSECLTGDALGSLRCDCGDQLRESLRLIAAHPDGGAVIYLRGQEGRGIGLINKIKAYALQDEGRDTVEANLDLGFPADLRSYGVAVQILKLLGVTRLKLLSNNPDKARALSRYGVDVAERIALRIAPNPHNAGYIETKREKMGHDFAAPVDGSLALPA